MPNEGRMTVVIQALIDDGSLQIGDGYRAKNSEMGTTGLPFARAGNVDGRLDLRETDLLVPSSVEKAGHKVSRQGDVVFTSKGTVGRFAFVGTDTPEFVYSPQLCFWRVHDRSRIEPRYLYFWMHGRECSVQFSAAKGSTDMADYISLKDQRTMHLTLPPLAEQRRIAWVLGSLDDKSELNRRIAETLEQIAAAIFRARFVDFIGVEEFEESVIGSIPQGWAVEPLADLVDKLTRGKQPKYLDRGGIQVLNQKCIRNARILFDQARRHDPSARDVSDRLVEVGDVLVNSTGVGTLGRVAQVRRLSEITTIDSHVTLVRASDEEIDASYLAASLVSRQGEIEALGHGSTGQTELSRSRLGELKVLVPPRDLQSEYALVQAELSRQIAALEQESELLRALRDTLLPKLISGEIRVPESFGQDSDPTSLREGDPTGHASPASGEDRTATPSTAAA